MNQIISFQDKLFQVNRKVKESSQPIIESWKSVTRSDTVLRKDGYYWFVSEISEVEFEEIDETEESQETKQLTTKEK